MHTCIDIHVQHQLWLSDFNQNRNDGTVSRNILQYHVSWIFIYLSSSRSMQTGGTDGMTALALRTDAKMNSLASWRIQEMSDTLNLPNIHCIARTNYAVGKKNPYWEVNSFSASQNVSRTLWNPDVHYHVHNITPPLPHYSQINPVHANPTH